MKPTDAAFPTRPVHDNKGMSMLEWYSGKAMQGMLAAEKGDLSDLQPDGCEKLASTAFRVARAMIAEGAKQ